MLMIRNNNGGGYGYLIRVLITVIDFLCINMAFFLIWFIFPDSSQDFCSKIIWLLLNISYLPVAYIFSNIHNNRMIHIDWVLVVALRSVAVYFVIFLSLLTFLKVGDDILPITLLRYFGLFFALLCLWWIISRKFLKYYRRKGYNFRRVVIVGAGRTGIMLYNALKSDEGYGYRFLGFFDDNEKLKRSIPSYLGTVSEVEKFVLENDVDELYCALPGSQDEKILRLMKFSEQNMVRFYIVPEINRYVFKRMHYQMLGGVPVLSIREESLEHPILRLLKRFFDLLFSSVMLVLFPLWLLPISLAVKVSSPGPVFFKQKRTGFKGKEFTCYKFRTMKVNKESDSVQATKGDSRVTKLGRFLRRTSLDELPQFINVFLGDMSVVGPRPHMIKHTEDYSKMIDR